MNLFDKISGKKLLKIQRLDLTVNYEFFSPYAIIISLEGLSEKLIISATNDGSCTDIRLTTDKEIKEDYGLEFGEHILNNLKPADELNLF